MSKLGKHIWNQTFNNELNLDYNYAIFPDSFTFNGVQGATTFDGTASPTIDQLYYDYSSIEHWSDVRDTLTASCLFVIDEIDKLYQATGGSAAYPGLTLSVQQALSKNFLIPKSFRDLIHTQEEQETFARELYICANESYEEDILKDAVTYISASDDTEAQFFINSEANFSSAGGGSVSSVNGQSGVVVLGLDDLLDVNVAGATNDSILIHNGTNWTYQLRPQLSIHEDSQNYMHYDPATGELYLEQLAITDVTVIDAFTSSSQYFDNPIYCDSHEEGDTVVFPNATNGVEVWMHNGGSSLTIADYVQIENPSVSESFIKSQLSADAPIYYNSATGVISITQSTSSRNGYLSSTDWQYFDSKVDTVNGKVGTVILTTSDIVEGTNKYYCAECAWADFSAGTAIGFNQANGTYYALIDDIATASNTVLWSAQKIYDTINSSTASLSDSYIIGLFSGVSPISVNSNGEISMTQSTSSNNGYLSSTDWTKFNDKIGGSGTDTYLAKFNSSGTISTSIIRDSGTALGIGAAPTVTDQLNMSTTTLTNSVSITNATNTASLSTGLTVNAYGNLGTKVGIHGIGNTIDTNQVSVGGVFSAQGASYKTHPSKQYAIIASVGGNQGFIHNSVGLEVQATETHLGNNYGIILDVSNSEGSAYIGILDDGRTPLADRYLRCIDANGTAEWADLKNSWTFGAASSATVTNAYLYQYGSVGTDIAPYVVHKNAKIISLSFSSQTTATWTAEIYVNDVLSASYPVDSQSTGYTSMDLSVSAGDRIGFYCNGTTIEAPSINILLREV